MSTQTSTRSPRFMDMTPAELRAAYWHHRNAGASWADMAQVPQSRRNRGRIAGSVFYHQDRMDLVVAVARKRGIDLLGQEA